MTATRRNERDEYAVRRDPTVLVVIAAVLALLWWLRSGNPPAAEPTAGSQIVAFGDSLVEGVGTTAGHDFVSLLSARLDVPIVNAGRSGDTTGTALNRLDSAVLSRDPRIVIVVLGGNDFLRRVPREETIRNLDTIAGRIRSRGAAVILAGLSLGVVTDAYGDGYEEVARQRQAGLVPDILGGIIGQQELMADHIHPNDRGHVLMADRLEPALRDLLK